MGELHQLFQRYQEAKAANQESQVAEIRAQLDQYTLSASDETKRLEILADLQQLVQGSLDKDATDVLKKLIYENRLFFLSARTAFIGSYGNNDFWTAFQDILIRLSSLELKYFFFPYSGVVHAMNPHLYTADDISQMCYDININDDKSPYYSAMETLLTITPISDATRLNLQTMVTIHSDCTYDDVSEKITQGADIEAIYRKACVVEAESLMSDLLAVHPELIAKTRLKEVLDNPKTLRILIRHEAPCLAGEIVASGKKSTLLLELVAHRKNTAAVEELLQSDMDIRINQVTANKQSESALSIAVAQGNLELVMGLLSRPDIDVSIPNNKPLLYALRKGNIHIAVLIALQYKNPAALHDVPVISDDDSEDEATIQITPSWWNTNITQLQSMISEQRSIIAQSMPAIIPEWRAQYASFDNEASNSILTESILSLGGSLGTLIESAITPHPGDKKHEEPDEKMQRHLVLVRAFKHIKTAADAKAAAEFLSKNFLQTVVYVDNQLLFLRVVSRLEPSIIQQIVTHLTETDQQILTENLISLSFNFKRDFDHLLRAMGSLLNEESIEKLYDHALRSPLSMPNILESVKRHLKPTVSAQLKLQAYERITAGPLTPDEMQRFRDQGVDDYDLLNYILHAESLENLDVLIKLNPSIVSEKAVLNLFTPEFIKVLNKNKVKFDFVYKDTKDTPLHMVLGLRLMPKDQQAKAVEALLESGDVLINYVNPTHTDTPPNPDMYQESALSFSIKAGKHQVTELLLNRSDIDVTIPSHKALKHALDAKDYALAQTITSKYKPDLKSDAGAVWVNHIIEQLADIDSARFEWLLKFAVDSDADFGPLIKALFDNNREEDLRYLPMVGQTPVQIFNTAIEFGRTDIAVEILAGRQTFNYTISQKTIQSALKVAILEGDLALVQTLLVNGAQAGFENSVALLDALFSQHNGARIFQMLLDSGADCNANGILFAISFIDVYKRLPNNRDELRKIARILAGRGNYVDVYQQISTGTIDVAEALLENQMTPVELEASRLFLHALEMKTFSVRQSHESAMEDHLTFAANEHFTHVVQPALEAKFNSFGESDEARRVAIEVQIRGAILDAMIATDKEHPSPNNQPILAFIQQHRATLVLGDDETMMNDFRELLNFETPTHNAWRAYDRFAPVHDFENLLTGGSTGSAFTTAAASEGPLTNQAASDILRTRVAYYFIADPKPYLENFIQQLADMHRCQEHENTETSSSPSCFPGGVGRVGLMGEKHELLELPPNRWAIIREVLKNAVVETFKSMAQELDPVAREELFAALINLSAKNADEILAKKIVYPEKYLQYRQQFKQALPPFSQMKASINQKYAQKKLTPITIEEQWYAQSVLIDISGAGRAGALTEAYDQMRQAAVQATAGSDSDVDDDNLGVAAPVVPAVYNPFVLSQATFRNFTPSIVAKSITKYIAFERVFGVFSESMGATKDTQNLVEKFVNAMQVASGDTPEARIQAACADIKFNPQKHVDLMAKVAGVYATALSDDDKSALREKLQKDFKLDSADANFVRKITDAYETVTTPIAPEGGKTSTLKAK